MSKVTPHDTRKKFVTQPVNVPQKKCLPTNKHEPFENHIWTSITSWTNVNKANHPLALKTSIYVPIIKQVRPEVVAQWKTSLESAGYTVNIDDIHLTVSIK